MQLITVRLDDPRVAPLLADLGAEYHARYGPGDEMTAANPEEFEPPGGLFVLLLDERGAPVAGAGYRRVADGVCEVKRMWTRADQRRQGHARRVLEALEEAARSAGYATVRLETGPAQPEAEALYIAHGYGRIPVYGRYPRALAFERRLETSAGTVSRASAAGQPAGGD